MKKIILVSLIMMFGNSLASDGVYAINSVCDGFGCFPGDSNGLPVTISEPGSYQLTSNLVSTSAVTDVIEITADNVTLDLNGFSIIGPRTCTGDNASLSCSNSGMTAHGVSAVGRKNIKVKNGIVKGFDTGVSLTSINSRGNVVENIQSSENEFGITVINGMVNNCVANRNLDTGISNALFGSTFVKDSFARGNKTRSIMAIACSNVYLSNNGTDNCGTYTNGSVCGGSLCP